MKESNANRFDAIFPECPDQCIQSIQVDGQLFGSVVTGSLRQFVAQGPGYESGGSTNTHVVQVGPILPLDMQHVPESLGGDEGRKGAPSLQDGIGGHRGAVNQEQDIIAGETRFGDESLDARHQCPARIGRRTRHFVEYQPARVGVGQDEIGKRAARVYGDSNAHGRSHSVFV